jgi:hypothetical protein
MIVSNINRTSWSSLRLFEKYAKFHKNFNCPIKLNFKDTTIHKYPCFAFTLLNKKMEDNFETRLKNIGNKLDQ